MTIRLGLVAASRIAQGAVVGPARVVDGIEVTAVAARSADTAAAAAGRWGIPRWYEGYEALLAADDVDAVYIGTPAALHRPWAVAALEAGKHVLCEKPLAANAEDARTILAASRARPHLVAMEAMHWRHHPIVETLRSLGPGIGTLRTIDAQFLVRSIPTTDIRWELSLGGGAMMDIGIYPVSWVRWWMGTEPVVESAEALQVVDRVDGDLVARLGFASSPVVATVRGSMVDSSDAGHRSWFTLTGETGRIHVTQLVAPQHGATIVVENDGASRSVDVPDGVTYVEQLDRFRRAIEDGSPVVTDVADGVRTMEAIDAIYEEAGLGVRPTSP